MNDYESPDNRFGGQICQCCGRDYPMEKKRWKEENPDDGCPPWLAQEDLF